jgi:pseudouridine synthase
MPDEPRQERLQKVLAHAGVDSRRKCEEYIAAGRVTVNGQVVTELGTKVDPQQDTITFDGMPIGRSELTYYVVYKPVGYVSTVRDPQGRPTARDLVPSKRRVYPVGRLDMDSEGLMFFTNDGQLAHRLMHPRYGHEKEYLVLIDGHLTPEELNRLRGGIVLEAERGGRDTVRVSVRVRQLPRNWRWRGQEAPSGRSWVRMTLDQGRKRQIRRMLEAVDHHVERLIRTRMGDLVLGDLHPGQGRWLSEEESELLRQSVGLET